MRIPVPSLRGLACMWRRKAHTFVVDEKQGERGQPQGRFHVNEMRENPRED